MSGQQSGQENPSGFLWIIAGIIVLALLAWYFGHSYIVAAIYRVKLFELNIIGLFSKHAKGIADWLYSLPPSIVTFPNVIKLCNQVGSYIRIPAAVTLLGCAAAIYFRQPNTRFKKTYDMESLVAQEKVNWPQVTPVVKQNLVDVHVEEGEWAMSITPMQFAKNHSLLKIEQAKQDEDMLETEVGYKVKVNKGSASRIFSLQLGRMWQGPEVMPPHMKALFAVFAAKANRDRDGASKIMKQLARSANETQFDYSGVDALLEKHKTSKNVMAVCARHAYEYTIMISMLKLAREDGVFASADFLWLKPVDRRLWFVLNTTGRQTSVPEVSGVYAHWLAESRLGKKLNVPMVHQAVRALEVAIAEVVYHPDEEKE